MTGMLNPVPPLNFRDVAGLPTVTGSSTRAGVLYRSDALYASDELAPLADLWPPATVIDLRREDERTPFDLAWADETAVHHLGFLDPALTRSSSNLAELYVRLLAARADAVAALINVAANTRGPTLVHCAAGKDRTGIVVAVLLRAAGVTRDAVVTDYLATGASARKRRDRVAAFGLELPPSTVPDEFYDVSEDAINAVLDVLEAGGSAPELATVQWLVEHGTDEADIAAWRQRLLGERLLGERLLEERQ
jgi:protein-tyrosine phosphatase